MHGSGKQVPGMSLCLLPKPHNISGTSKDLDVYLTGFVRKETKEDFVQLVSKQTSAVAQPVLSSETDFCYLLQPSFSFYHFYGLLKFAEWVLSPKEENEGWYLSAELVFHVGHFHFWSVSQFL